MHPLTGKLLARGDFIEISQGKLIIESASGRPVPNDWLAKKSTQILLEICRATDQQLFQYTRYSTGFYGTSQSYSGLTLTYENILTDETFAVHFNADLTRAITTKNGRKGSRLPKDRFRVGKKYAFTKYWHSLGLETPKRFSDFHERMGKLGTVLVTANINKKNKIEKSSVQLANLSHAILTEVFLTARNTDNIPTISRQAPDNYPTAKSDNKTEQTRTQHAFPRVSGTSNKYQEKSNKEKTDKGTHPPQVSRTLIIPNHQTTEEWLEDYEQADRNARK